MTGGWLSSVEGEKNEEDSSLIGSHTIRRTVADRSSGDTAT